MTVAAWVRARLFPQRERVRNAFPLPLALGGSMDATRALITWQHGEDPALDETFPAAGRSELRERIYRLPNDERPATRLIYRYRIVDQVIWSISLSDVWSFDGMFGRVPLSADFDELVSLLGLPERRSRRAALLDRAWWRDADVTYVADFYERRRDLRSLKRRRGEIEALEMYLPSLAPRDYD